MFFTAKLEELMNSLSKDVRHISEHAQIQSKKLEKVSARVKKLTEHNDLEDEFFEGAEQAIMSIDDKVLSVQKSIKKNNATLGDLLQEWSELRKQQKQLIEFMADSYKESKEESQAREEIRSLLDLVMTYHDQVSGIFAMLQGDNSWKIHLDSMNQKLQDACRMCGMDVLGRKNEAIRPEFHEVLDILGPAMPDSPLVVETVVENGYLYRGQVLRKARVIASSPVEAAQSCSSVAASLDPLLPRRRRYAVSSPDSSAQTDVLPEPIPQVEGEPTPSKPKKKKRGPGKKRHDPLKPAVSETELQAENEFEQLETSLGETFDHLPDSGSPVSLPIPPVHESTRTGSNITETDFLAEDEFRAIENARETPSSETPIMDEDGHSPATDTTLNLDQDDNDVEEPLPEDKLLPSEVLESTEEAGELLSSRDHLMDEDDETPVSGTSLNPDQDDNDVEEPLPEAQPLPSEVLESSEEAGELPSSRDHLMDEDDETPVSGTSLNLDQDDNDVEEPLPEAQPLPSEVLESTEEVGELPSSRNHLIDEDEETPVSGTSLNPDQDDNDIEEPLPEGKPLPSGVLESTEETGVLSSSRDHLIDEDETPVSGTSFNLDQDDNDVEEPLPEAQPLPSEVLESTEETCVLPSSRDHLFDEDETPVSDTSFNPDQDDNDVEEPLPEAQSLPSEVLESTEETGVLSSSRDHLMDEEAPVSDTILNLDQDDNDIEEPLPETQSLPSEVQESTEEADKPSSSMDHLGAKEEDNPVSGTVLNFAQDSIDVGDPFPGARPLPPEELQSMDENEGGLFTSTTLNFDQDGHAFEDSDPETPSFSPAELESGDVAEEQASTIDPPLEEYEGFPVSIGISSINNQNSSDDETSLPEPSLSSQQTQTSEEENDQSSFSMNPLMKEF